MIKIKLISNNDYIDKIIIRGHALYDDFGKDIVCAAVSSSVITVVNALLSIDNKSLIYDDKDGLDITLLKKDDITIKIINSMISNLYELEKAYPKNVEIRKENRNE